MRRFIHIGILSLVLLLVLATDLRATSGELYALFHLFPNVFDDPLNPYDEYDRVVRDVEQNRPPLAVDPVVTSVGEYITWNVDLDLGGPLPLGFARHHATNVAGGAAGWGFQTFTESPMGGSWTHNFHYLLQKISDTEVAVLYDRGMVVFFEKTPGVAGSVWEMTQPPIGFTYKGTPYQMVETGSKLEVMDPVSRHVLSFEFASLAIDDASKVESIRDRNGNTLTLTYGASDQLLSVEDGLGRTLTFQNTVISGFYRITGVTDQAGRSWSYGYTFPILVSATDPRGGITQYDNLSNFRISSVTRPRGNLVLQNTYNGSQVTTQTDGEGNVHSFVYGPSSTTITDPLGHSRIHTFDGELRMTSFQDEAGRTIDYTYDALHRMTSCADRMADVSTVAYHDPSGYVASRTDNLGNTWSYTYEAQVQDGFTFHVLTRIDYPDGTSTTMTRDANGNLVSLTDPEGNTTTFTFNSRGQVATMTNAAGGVTSFTYNPDATLATRQDPSGNVTSYTYDAAKRVIAIERPDGETMAYTYDAHDNVLSITDENGHTTSYVYDANDNLVSRTDPLGNQTTFAYDDNDDRVSMTDPLGQTTTYTYDGLRRRATRTDPGDTRTYAYDARRRLESVTDELGQVWSYTYDDEGVLTSATDPLGQAYLVFSDPLGRITEIHDPLGNQTEYVYDELGRLVQMTDPLGQTTAYQRDANGLTTRIDTAEPGISTDYTRTPLLRISQITDARANGWSHGYDSQARRVSRTDPLGNQHTYAYDSRSRIAQATLPGGMGTIDHAYDAADRLTQWTASDGTSFAFSYDAKDRLTSTTGLALTYSDRDEITECNGLQMAYDADRRLETITFEPGKTVTYAYDARDQLTTVSDWAGGVTTLAYDDDGLLTSIEHASGVVTSYTYDPADRLVGIQEEGPGASATTLSSIDLTLDGDGQTLAANRATPLQATPIAGSSAHTYDAANQVTGHVYDALGRPLDDGERTYSWNLAEQLDQYTQGTAVSFTRDAFGNMLSRTDDAGTREYAWNYALGIPSIAVESDGGAPLRYYVHTPDGRLLYRLEADDTRLVYHYDEMGNTLFLTDAAGGIVQRYAYSPYGEILAEDGPVENLFTYHGRYGVVREPASGGELYSMRARYYDAALARFVSRDRLELFDPQSINPYHALRQNPLRYVDPWGTDPWEKSPGRSVKESSPSLERGVYEDLMQYPDLFELWFHLRKDFVEEDVPAFLEHVRRRADRDLLTPEQIEAGGKWFDEYQRKMREAKSKRDADNDPDLMRDSYTDGVDEAVL